MRVGSQSCCWSSIVGSWLVVLVILIAVAMLVRHFPGRQAAVMSELGPHRDWTQGSASDVKTGPGWVQFWHMQAKLSPVSDKQAIPLQSRHTYAVVRLQSAIVYSLRVVDGYCINGVRPRYETYAWSLVSRLQPCWLQPCRVQHVFVYIHISAYRYYIDGVRVYAKVQRHTLGA